jgi:hypothetical protein
VGAELAGRRPHGSLPSKNFPIKIPKKSGKKLGFFVFGSLHRVAARAQPASVGVAFPLAGFDVFGDIGAEAGGDDVNEADEAGGDETIYGVGVAGFRAGVFPSE